MDKPELQQTLQTFFPTLNKESIHSLGSFCMYRKVSKQTEIISEGKRHPYTYIILEGAAKSYYLKDGKEICIWFAFENEAIGSMSTFQDLPSTETITLLEDSHLLQISLKELGELAQRDLSTSHMLTELIMEHAMYTEEKLRQMQFMTAQERYTTLLQKEPSVLQRVSLTDIASYLGVSRETLSRIRGKK